MQASEFQAESYRASLAQQASELTPWRNWNEGAEFLREHGILCPSGHRESRLADLIDDGVKTGTKPKKGRFFDMRVVFIYEGDLTFYTKPTIRNGQDLLSYCQMT